MRATMAAVAAGSLIVMGTSLSAAQAVPAAKAHKRQVVKVVTRHPFGKMLAAKHDNRSLYILPSGHCRGDCLTIWPPLLLPKGSTAVPAGVKCLGTAKFAHLRQITYRGHRLYKFEDDSGSSVTGNGLDGFVVAKFSTGKCHK